MLMISQVYWELTKIYDKTPKLQDDFGKALNQFVLFTINHPYQVVNAEILRRHLKANPSPNLPIFKAAYDKIFIESSKCYIATYAYGEQHWITRCLRNWKSQLNQSKYGLSFIKLYYYCSSRLVQTCEKNHIYQTFFTTIFRPILFCFAKFLNKFILKP
jgi:hypothetical protein